MMNAFERLTSQINQFKQKHDIVPSVTVSHSFWEQYAHQIADLSDQGIGITVTPDLASAESFLLAYPNDQHPTIDSLYDLKDEVDRLIDQGKGHWPVKFLPYDANVYLQIKLCPIVPGKEPVEGLQLQSDFADAPEGEHVLVLFGQDKLE